jgi:hypothetical protein
LNKVRRMAPTWHRTVDFQEEGSYFSLSANEPMALCKGKGPWPATWPRWYPDLPLRGKFSSGLVISGWCETIYSLDLEAKI